MDIYFPHLPERSVKPRNMGLTMVMDKGLSLREAEDLMSVGSEVIDYVIEKYLPDKLKNEKYQKVE